MLIILVIIILVLCYILLSYRRMLRSLGEQVDFKIKSKSNVRIRLDYQNKDFEDLASHLDELFMFVNRESYLVEQDKKALDRAISNVAHDIRTPLAVSRGYTQQLLRDKEFNEAVLEKVHQNLIVASTRLEMLLEYRRILERAIVPSSESVNIKELVTKELFSFYDAFNEAQFDVEMELNEVTLTTDAELLERILQNVFSNVLKHGKEKLRISLKNVDKGAFLEVSNITKKKIENLERLTMRFYSENLSESEESSGLGLYIVEELVHSLGGELRLFAEGEEFTLCIIFKNS